MKARMVRCGAVALLALTGCRGDFSQQLLERELRYQEDQIYQLQDDLQEKCARVERLSGENASLRRQLGIGDAGPTPRSGPARSRPATVAPGVVVPPARSLPEGAPGNLAPPALEGIPPLPRNGGAAAPATIPARPVADADDGPALALPDPVIFDPTARPAREPAPPPVIRSLSYESPLPTGVATRLVIDTSRSRCIDADADGRSESLLIAVEPRDAEERLVAVTAAVTVTVWDATLGSDPATGEISPLARWDIPAAEAARHFRPTSRNRGLQFSLPWPAAPPAADHVRVSVRLAGPEISPLAADVTLATR